MSADIRKLEKMASKVNAKIKKIYNDDHDSSLRTHPSELAEVRNVLTVASKTLRGNNVYFENNIEKAGYSSFHLSDTLEILKQILDRVEKRKQATIRLKTRRDASSKKSS